MHLHLWMHFLYEREYNKNTGILRHNLAQKKHPRGCSVVYYVIIWNQPQLLKNINLVPEPTLSPCKLSKRQILLDFIRNIKFLLLFFFQKSL